MSGDVTGARNEDSAVSSDLEQLIATATAWRDQDPDDETRDELGRLLSRAGAHDADAAADLADRFAGRLQFGTAGLRGALGSGSNRMNRVLVAQAAAGFAAFLRGREAHPSIVIGYDGRKNSDVFARDTAEIMAAAGVTATILPRALPTPVLAFAVRHLDVSAGVMVTASHNPAQDNGYKVYLGGVDAGSQIVSPVDGEIATEIEKAAQSPVTHLARSDDYREAGDDLVMEYVRRTASVAGTAATGRQPRVVYTAMHGVGWEVARRVFATAGFAEPIPVGEQSAPDPAFPTVAFPNPEEPGALDLSFATAERVEADLVIANDPDADRLAVAIPVDGGWRRLSGNEVGSLLGWRAAERARRDDRDGTLAASIVSSPALREIARVHGLDYVDTLTGFKWVSRVGGLLYGYEEALGYLVDPDVVRDKDGISAAVDLLALATELHTAGSSLAEHLVAFDERFGAYASSQISIRVDDLATITALTDGLRRRPPATIGSHRVDRVDDFRDGFGAFPAGDILRYWLTDGSRVIVRPSGTEPKLKVYIDASSTEGDAVARRTAAEAAVADLDAGMRALLT
ncbi:phospho-sugar mutase [Frigoribacterium sp. CFBP 8751]|uniref:phospho-sugar mutase n=1 Tax=Frigoribacterium sp. CFBP 8751 TaxID=2775277 RepID=UPI000B22C4B0|nr:phospho-sugar mutase [Frigoribacterium sp. MEB024]